MATGSTIQGSVSIVQLGNMLNGETVPVTFVSFWQNGTSQSVFPAIKPGFSP